MNGSFVDIHGAGCQRSDPKAGEADYGQGPQGDVQRIDNFVRVVRGGATLNLDAGSGVPRPCPTPSRQPTRNSRPNHPKTNRLPTKSARPDHLRMVLQFAEKAPDSRQRESFQSTEGFRRGHPTVGPPEGEPPAEGKGPGGPPESTQDPPEDGEFQRPPRRPRPT